MIIGYNPETRYEQIGDETQYFLDDTMLKWVKNITRTHHVAVKYPANPSSVGTSPGKCFRTSTRR